MYGCTSLCKQNYSALKLMKFTVLYTATMERGQQLSAKSALCFSAFEELTERQLSRDLGVVHPDNTSCPSMLGFKNHDFSAAGLCPFP